MFFKIILILLLVFLILLLLYKYSSSNTSIQESYIHYYDDYVNCLRSGYTKLFCTQNEIQPNLCVCKNGSVGKIIPGFKGRCICNKNKFSNDYNFNYYKYYTDNINDFNIEKQLNETNSKKEFNNKTKSNIQFEKPISNINNYLYKRNIYKNIKNIIPYSDFGNYSFF